MFQKVLILILIAVLARSLYGAPANIEDDDSGSITYSEEDLTYEPISEHSEEDVMLLPDKMSPILQIKEHLAGLSSNVSLNNMNDKQLNEKHELTRVMLHQVIDGLYNCTPESILSEIGLRSEFDNYFVCNQVLDLIQDSKLNATIKTQTKTTLVTLTLTKSPVQIVFFRGNQLYHSSGTVSTGYCKGEKFDLFNVNLVMKGSCKTRTGVTELGSDYAMLSVTGRCKSTCFGEVTIQIAPGLRN